MNQKEFTYSQLQKKKWRAITYDYDALSVHSDESRLYCLTDFQVAWLQSNIPYYNWRTRWFNTNATQQELNEQQSELELALMSCVGLPVWQLQAVYDNGVNGLLTAYDDSWDGSDPQSVNSNAPATYFNGDGSNNRNTGLCNALTSFVYTYALTWAQKASVLNGLINASIFLADLLIPIGGTVAVKVITDLTSGFQAQVDAMGDVDALDTIICNWKDALVGQTISLSNWTNTVQALSYTVDTPEYYIQQLLSEDTQLLENFLSFVNALGEGYELAQLGVSICPCVETWQHTFDFIADNTAQGWTAFSGRADLQSDGWHRTIADVATVQIERSFTEATITSVEMFNSGLASGVCGNKYLWRFPDVGGSDGSIATDDSQTDTNVTSDGIWVSLCANNSDAIRIEKIILSGTGINPF